MSQHIKVKDKISIPKLGMGTWYLGEDRSKREEEIAAIRAGLDRGIEMIDTAEMYGEGLSEELVGEAIKGYDRDKMYLVSKVYPHNAGKNKIYDSIQNTLRRLGTDYLDLYLLHWRGGIPLSETVTCMEELVKKGMIKS